MTTIQLRRGTAAEWTAANPILSPGECGIELDTAKCKYGDGRATWNELVYHIPEPVIDGKISASMADHLAQADPHPGYLTPTEGNNAYEPIGTMANHLAQPDPHPQYLTTGEGNAAYEPAGAVAAHAASADPHPSYLQPSEVMAGANIEVDTTTSPGAVIISGQAGGGGGVPIGAILSYAGTMAPEGWHLCDGSAHGSPELEAALLASGFATPANTPDLRDRFIVGVGGSALGDIGGVDAVQLTAAQSGLPAHNHAASSAAETTDHTHSTNPSSVTSGTVSAWHTHSGTSSSGGPTHTHDSATHEGITSGDSDTWIDSADDDTAGGDDWNTIANSNTAIGHTHTLTTGNPNTNHTHAVDVPATTSGGRSAGHTHGITVNNAVAQPAAEAHENRPPFYALAYIIKK